MGEESPTEMLLPFRKRSDPEPPRLAVKGARQGLAATRLCAQGGDTVHLGPPAHVGRGPSAVCAPWDTFGVTPRPVLSLRLCGSVTGRPEVFLFVQEVTPGHRGLGSARQLVAVPGMLGRAPLAPSGLPPCPSYLGLTVHFTAALVQALVSCLADAGTIRLLEDPVQTPTCTVGGTWGERGRSRHRHLAGSQVRSDTCLHQRTDLERL